MERSRFNSDSSIKGELSTASMEMNTMGSTIQNLHAIQEEDEEEEATVTQTQLTEEQQSQGSDSKHKLSGRGKTRRNSATESTRDEISPTESEIHSPQDTPLSSSSQGRPDTFSSDADPEVIENPYIEQDH